MRQPPEANDSILCIILTDRFLEVHHALVLPLIYNVVYY